MRCVRCGSSAAQPQQRDRGKAECWVWILRHGDRGEDPPQPLQEEEEEALCWRGGAAGGRQGECGGWWRLCRGAAESDCENCRFGMFSLDSCPHRAANNPSGNRKNKFRKSVRTIVFNPTCASIIFIHARPHLCRSASFFSSMVMPLSSSLSLSPVPGTD